LKTSDVKFNLKEDAKPYHAKAFLVPKFHHNTLTHEIEKLVGLGVLKGAVTQNGPLLHSLYIRKWHSKIHISFQETERTA
jgi:hypothetical protein